MVFRGRSTRRTRRDLMVLMSLPLVPLQGRKRHKNNRGNRLLLSQVAPRGVCGYPGWLWWWNWLGLGLFFYGRFCVHPRQGCRQDEPASPGMDPAARGEGWGGTGSWQGSATGCPGFVTSQPLTRSWGPSCPDSTPDKAPRQGSSTGTGGSAPPSCSRQEKGQSHTWLFPLSWMRQGLFLRAIFWQEHCAKRVWEPSW